MSHNTRPRPRYYERRQHAPTRIFSRGITRTVPPDTPTPDQFPDPQQEQSAHAHSSPSDPFSYLPVRLLDLNADVLGLVDTGSSVNVIQKSTLLQLGGSAPSLNRPLSVRLADGRDIHVEGIVTLNVQSASKSTRETFYVFEKTSHPLILGVSFSRTHNVSFDWTRLNGSSSPCDVRCTQAVTLKPGTETIITGKLPHSLLIGTQGVCDVGKHAVRKNVLCARCVVSKMPHGRVPVKVYNPHSVDVVINKGDVVAKFWPFGHNFKLHSSLHSVSSISSSPVNTERCHDAQSFVHINEITVSDKLLPEQEHKLTNLLFDFRQGFLTKENPDMGLCDAVKMKINLKPNAKAKYHRPYRLTPEKKEVLKYQLEHLLEQGIIAPLNEQDDAPIVSPVVLVEKRNVSSKSDNSKCPKEHALTSFRFVVDYRFLNDQIADFKYAIPDMADLTDTFASARPKFISKLDLSSSFHQLKIDEQSQKYTAFSTPFNTYMYKRIPMGLKLSPNIFQMCIDKILANSSLSYKTLACYIDDVLLYHSDFDEHLKDLRELLQCLTSAGLKLNPKKCSFAHDECVFLGHKISQAGIEPPADKLDAVRNYPKPKNEKELKRFLSFMGWFRKFINQFSVISFPLAMLLKKGTKFVWSKECDDAFEALKVSLLDSPALSYPRSDVEYVISVDSSSKGIGYVLYYLLPERESHNLSERERVRVIKFGSRTLKSYQRSYSPCKLELLGVTTAVLDLADYIRGRPVKVLCDHQALQPLLNKQCRGAIFSRWATILQQFQLSIEYRPAGEMVVPDALSRCHSKPSRNLEIDSPVENEDPFFPYVTDKPTRVVLPGGQSLADLVNITSSDEDTTPSSSINHDRPQPPPRVSCVRDTSIPTHNRFSILSDCDAQYDADTSEVDCESITGTDAIAKRRVRRERRKRVEQSDTADAFLDDNALHPVYVTNTNAIDDSYVCSDSFDMQSNVIMCDNDIPTHDDDLYYDCYESLTDVIRHYGPLDIPANGRDNVCVIITGSPPPVDLFTGSTDCYFGAATTQSSDDSTHVSPDGCAAATASSQQSSVETDLQRELDKRLQSLNEFQNSDFTPDKIGKLQRLDPDLSSLIAYLEDGRLPKSQKQSRRLLVKSADYILVDGVLFHRDSSTRKRVDVAKCSYQLVLPKVMQRAVIELYHDSPLMAHAGIQITIDRLRQDYYFDKMCVLVTDYVKSCEPCQKRKVTRYTKSPTTALPTPNRLFEAWELDLYGPLHLSSQGHSYVFIATDMFSRYTYAVPIRSKDCVTVSLEIFNLCCTFGTPRAIYSDLGSEFTASLVEHVCKLLGVPQKFAPAFCHFVLGKNERTHRSLAERLTPYVADNKPTWDQYISAIVFSLNTSIHSALKYSPWEVVFGEKPRFPLSSPIELCDVPAVPKDYKTYLRLQQEKLEIIRDEVKTNTQKAYATMCAKANANVHPINVEKGDYVYLSHGDTAIGSKLDYRFQGPFVIHDVTSTHIVTLKDPVSMVLKGNIHVNRLKPAHVRFNDPQFAECHPEFFPPLTTRSADTGNNNQQSVPDDHNMSVTATRDPPAQTPRRSARLDTKNTVRYADDCTLSSSSDENAKVKKFLGQKETAGITYYLVHLKGESSNQAVWMPSWRLNSAARRHVGMHPPPMIN